MADAAERKPSHEPGPPALLWVDEEGKVVSFHQEEGFRPLSFPSRDAMLTFAFEKGVSGFRVQ